MRLQGARSAQLWPEGCTNTVSGDTSSMRISLPSPEHEGNGGLADEDLRMPTGVSRRQARPSITLKRKELRLDAEEVVPGDDEGAGELHVVVGDEPGHEDLELVA